MRADARNARRKEAATSTEAPPAPDGAALIRRLRATFSRVREKEDYFSVSSTSLAQ